MRVRMEITTAIALKPINIKAVRTRPCIVTRSGRCNGISIVDVICNMQNGSK